MTRKPRPKPVPPPKPVLVVSNNLPRITIRPHGVGGVQLTIPGYNRDTVALAHALTAVFLGDIKEHQWSQILSPRIGHGDRLMTCTTVNVDLICTTVNVDLIQVSHVYSGARPYDANGMRARVALLTDLLRDAAVRACRPGFTRHSTHTVIVLEDP